jgi:hypothetical protein
MRFYRVGLPALTGLVILFAAVQSIRVVLDSSGTEPLLDAAHSWLLPIALAVGLLLAALAIARRSRLGYLLGLALSIVMVFIGLGVIAIEIPYLGAGGFGAAIGAGVVVLASGWILAWAIYGISMRRAASSFAAEWQPTDRSFGVVLGSLAAFAAVAWLSLGFVLNDQVAVAESGRTQAAALVAATSTEARVIEATFGPAPDGSGVRVVETLSLELTFVGSQEYRLARVPTVCLTDAATSSDPAFKMDVYCWGGGGPAIVLSDAFGDLVMPGSPRSVRLDLQRGASLCAFGAGSWTALVGIVPLVDGADAGFDSEVSTRLVSFVVTSPGGTPPSGTGAETSCFDATVSP